MANLRDLINFAIFCKIFMDLFVIITSAHLTVKFNKTKSIDLIMYLCYLKTHYFWAFGPTKKYMYRVIFWGWLWGFSFQFLIEKHIEIKFIVVDRC